MTSMTETRPAPDEFGPPGDWSVASGGPDNLPDTSNPNGVGLCASMRPGEMFAYICTRPLGHDGRHVAGDTEFICAVWS